MSGKGRRLAIADLVSFVSLLHGRSIGQGG
jgi:hypothetical protein